MRVTVVGADFEENLGVGMIAAVAAEAGHAVEIVPFNDPERTDGCVARVLSTRPDVVGLSMQFQHRAHEFLGLARKLRARGFAGHVTCGGQFPTLAWREALDPRWGIDSVVLHEGEETFPELLLALVRGARLADVPGLALRADDGAPTRTAGRRLSDELDRFPYPRRYRPHTRHLGVPFIPVMGGRGCWGRCTYCSITSFYRDARAHGGGGKTLRQRSPSHVAGEMALLWHAAGGPSIFCFHDDNFVLPRPADTLARVRELRDALDGYGVERLAIVGKARPDTLTPELARSLADLGVIRLYVGVENASEHGAADLRRGAQTAAVRAALRACREAGIFVCYNLLVFEPQATLADVRENVAFVREHADHPVNFCRAEPYYGTPLHLELSRVQELGGSYLGWNYRIEDTRTELLFRIAAAAFRERNFAMDGVANRYMSLGYAAKVLERFHGERDALARGRVRLLASAARELTREISLDTAAWLEEAVDLAERADLEDREAIERETAMLGLKVAAADRLFHARLDDLFEEMEAHAVATPLPVRPRVPQKMRELAQAMTLGASIAVWAASLEGCFCSDMLVPDAGRDAGSDAFVADPPPPDAGRDAMPVDPPPPDAGRDAMPVDPPPPDAGRDAMPVDPAPFDASFPVDPAPWDAAASIAGGEGPVRLAMIDQWRDTAAQRTVRTTDLPLYEPPVVRVSGERDGEVVVATLCGGPEAVGLRWESEGRVEGEGRTVRWTPAGPDDSLRVAARTRGGVAVVTLRARRAVEAS